MVEMWYKHINMIKYRAALVDLWYDVVTTTHTGGALGALYYHYRYAIIKPIQCSGQHNINLAHMLVIVMTCFHIFSGHLCLCSDITKNQKLFF